MKFFKASFATIILRYYLMMFVVVGAFVINMEYLAILSLPIFLSAIMGVKFELPKMRQIVIKNNLIERTKTKTVAV